MNLVEELHRVTRALRDAGVVHAVCGGIAVTIHGATRSTKDIDLLVPGAEVPRILEVVRDLGYLFAALPMTFDEGNVKERHVQRVTKVDGGDHLILDLLVADSSLQGLLEGRIEVVLPEGTLSVVSKSALLKMTRLAGRPQDLADLAALEALPDGS